MKALGIVMLLAGLVVAGFFGYRHWEQTQSSSQAANDVVDRILSENLAPDRVAASYSCQADSAMCYAAIPSSTVASFGLSAGGAKDVGNFRANIAEGYLPLPTDLADEGLFYDYYFDTGQRSDCNELFCPSSSGAISRDPLSGETEYYMTVGLNSNLTEESFARPRLNLVIVLDVSGSMGNPFTSYYYDAERPDRETDVDATKLDSAKAAIAGMLDHLQSDDQIGLVVFSDGAVRLCDLSPVGADRGVTLETLLSELQAQGGTNLESGLALGYELLEDSQAANLEDVESRVVLLTDMMPNVGTTSDYGLKWLIHDQAQDGIFTTFVGVGVDFGSELMASLYDVRGANAFTVQSTDDFIDLMSDEFAFHVTPVAFDIELEVVSDGYLVEKVYGSTAADEARDSVFEIRTLFPSRREDGETRGGVILVKLVKISDDPHIDVGVRYMTRDGDLHTTHSTYSFPISGEEFYADNGIRKAIVLTRYADLLRAWMAFERLEAHDDEQVAWEVPTWTCPCLSQWERMSEPLEVTEPYSTMISHFLPYFRLESELIGDESLTRETDILELLAGWTGRDEVDQDGREASGQDPNGSTNDARDAARQAVNSISGWMSR